MTCACSQTLPRRVIIAVLRKPGTARQARLLRRAAARVLAFADWAAVRAETLLDELEMLP